MCKHSCELRTMTTAAQYRSNDHKYSFVGSISKATQEVIVIMIVVWISKASLSKDQCHFSRLP